jgi:ABC-2 type transport system permease protein
MTRKELKLWLQRPGQWVVLFLAPFLFVAVMGQVFGGGSAPTVTIYAVDEDGGRGGRQVMDAIEDIDNLKLEFLSSHAEADERVGRGQRMAAVVIPAGFTQALTTREGAQIEVIVDPAREQTAGMVVGQVSAAVAPILVDAEVARGVGTAFEAAEEQIAEAGININDTNIDVDAARKFLTAAMQGVVSSQVQDAIDNPLVRVELEPARKDGQIERAPTIFEYLVPGYTLFFAFFLLAMIAQVILTERTSGTFRRLLAMPVPHSTILLGKIVPYFIIVLFQIIGVIMVCSLTFGVQLGQSPWAFLLMASAASAAVVGLGIMLAALVHTEGQARSVPNLLTIVLAVASGALFPSIQVPLAHLLTPHYWAIRGFQDVMTRGLGIGGVLDEVGILYGMAAIFFLIGIARFRFE